MIVLASSGVYAVFMFFLGINLLSKSLAIVSILVYIVIISASYITFGKLIWNYTWSVSLKSNIIWITFLVTKIALKIEHINLFQFYAKKNQNQRWWSRKELSKNKAVSMSTLKTNKSWQFIMRRLLLEWSTINCWLCYRCHL